MSARICEDSLMDNGDTHITCVLKAASNGDPEALSNLLPLVYRELREMAQSWMAKTPPGQTLQPTALVHEAYLRLVSRDAQTWENRGHFFFAAGRAMRDILIERARSRKSLKRGGHRARVDFGQLEVAMDAPGDDLLALDEALSRFEQEFPRESRIVTLRFFAGLSHVETSRALNVPLRTIERDWRFARAWLHQALSADHEDGSP